MRLFKSHRPDYKDGEQLRDFIYVKDAVKMTLFFLDNPDIGGIYNIGTGRTQSWNDVAAALFKAAGQPLAIAYIPMPDHLQGKYQYHTCADLTKLQAAGWSQPCRPLEDAIDDYVGNYLSTDAHLSSD
jgi:ADP-L-glycero-D-manno-heptose 6-epimerase